MRSQVRSRVAKRTNAISHSIGLITELTRRRRSDFLPVLKNPAASRRRRKFRRSGAARWAEARALVSRIGDLVYPAAHLTSTGSTFRSPIHWLGPRARL